MSAKSDHIKPFDGSEISVWKSRMLLHIRKNKLFDLLEKPIPSVRNRTEEWTLRDDELKEFITSKVNDKIFKLIMNKKYSKDMWESILVSFEQQSKIKLCEVRNSLYRMKYSEGESISEFLFTYRSLMDEAEALGDRLEEKDYILQLLKCLPSTFLPLKISLAEKILYMSWEQILSQIVEFEKELNGQKIGSQSKVEEAALQSSVDFRHNNRNGNFTDNRDRNFTGNRNVNFIGNRNFRNIRFKGRCLKCG